MSKYIIELNDKCARGIVVFGKKDEEVISTTQYVENLEVLNSDYINEHYGSLQDEAYKKGINDGSLDVKQRVEGAYQRGLEDAWECGKKLAWTAKYGGYGERLNDVFGRDDTFDFYDYTPNEAIEKLKAFEQKQDKIEIGDVVERYLNDKLDSTGIYLGEDGDYWNCLFWTGAVFGTFAYPKNQFKKTEKHVDIASILEAMKHD